MTMRGGQENQIKEYEQTKSLGKYCNSVKAETNAQGSVGESW